MDRPKGDKTTTFKEACSIATAKESWGTEAPKDTRAIPQSSGMAGPSKVQSKKKLKKNGNWSDAQLRAAFRAVERGAKVCPITMVYLGAPSEVMYMAELSLEKEETPQYSQLLKNKSWCNIYWKWQIGASL